jgi:hypothetical protein
MSRGPLLHEVEGAQGAGRERFELRRRIRFIVFDARDHSLISGHIEAKSFSCLHFASAA